MEMKTTNRAILINCAIVAGLIIAFYRGAAVSVIAISALVLFAVANLALFAKAKQHKA